MKLKLSGALVLALTTSPCFAQSPSNVTLYGAIDTAIEHFTNANANGDSATRMATLTGGQLPSRWGIRGSEAFEGGLKAIFNLESGFFIDSGNSAQTGRLFGRTAYVGLEHQLGSITLGRQPTMLFWSLFDADVIGPSAFSMASFDTYVPNARTDNTIAYRGKFGGLTVGGTYSLGRDTSAAGACAGENVSQSSACTAWSGLVKYDSSTWGVAAVYDEQRGGAGAAPVNVVPGAAGTAVTRPDDRDRRYMANGYLRFANLKVGGGWLHRNISGTARDVSTNLYFVGASYPIANWAVDAQVLRYYADAYQARGTMAIGRASYNFSRRTSSYVMLSRMDNSGSGSAFSVSSSSIVPFAPAPGKDQTGVLVGLRHSF
jgi:predicted porin